MQGLGPPERRDLALQALAHTGPLTQLASTHGVSRKFVYQQAAKASAALDRAFDETAPDDEVLFYLPVTKAWLCQLVLTLALVGHSSMRGICELLRDLFDLEMSLGTVHNILHRHVAQARSISDTKDLSRVRVGAHDEIFQASKPVLVGIDAQSTYCYLLAAVEHRDETSWGVHLLDLAQRGLAPDYTIADAGQALRAGQAQAWPSVPCHGDVFHAERELGELSFYLQRRAQAASAKLEALEYKMLRARICACGNTLSRSILLARNQATQALAVDRDVRILSDWFCNDVLSRSGPPLATRRELYDFIVRELRAREALCPHRIAPLCRKLENQRDALLAFAVLLQDKLDAIAAEFQVAPHAVQALCQLQHDDPNHSAYWTREALLHRQLGPRFHPIRAAVLEALASITRASSLVENLNSRLRDYFFLRQHLGDDYLDLLRFFLNHRRFARSEHPERVGKSPAELLSGVPHAHWLELLGFRLFKRT